jgi:predicted enzyme related to lactoylglutathione lyase
MHGNFYWNELMTSDPEGATAFYSALVGWEVVAMPMPGADGQTYWVMKNDGKPVGGIMAMPPGMPAGIPPHWSSYVAVADVDASAKRVTELGGMVHKPPFDIPEVGRMAVIGDPTGAVIHLITPVAQG